MKRLIVVCALLFGFCLVAFAQDPVYPEPWLEWAMGIGDVYKPVALPDGVLIGGWLREGVLYDSLWPGDQPHIFGGNDMYVARMDGRGTVRWAKRFGSAGSFDFFSGIAGLPDGSCAAVVAEISFGTNPPDITFAYGEPNETTFPGQCAFLVVFDADGRMRWVQPMRGFGALAVWQISMSPDGTIYVCTWINTGSHITFGQGTPREITLDSPGVLACYTGSGEFQWAVPACPSGVPAALTNSCAVLCCHGDLTHFGSEGQTLWSGSLANVPGTQVSIEPIPGTNDFCTFWETSSAQTVGRYTISSGQPTVVWKRSFANQCLGGTVAVRPDGSGMAIMAKPSPPTDPNSYHYVYRFTPAGVMSPRSTLFLNGGDTAVSAIPGSTTGFYCAGIYLGIPLGEGQPHETTFATVDYYLGQYYLEPQPAAVSVTVLGPGQVSLDPPGGSYNYGTEVTLRAAVSPPGHGVFLRWEGDLTGAEPEGTLTMDDHKNVTAVFQEYPRISLSVIGWGGVTLDPPGGWYPIGTEVALHAAPLWPGHDVFVEWDGDLTGPDPDGTLTIDGNKAVTAIFEMVPGAPPLPAASCAALAVLSLALALTFRKRM
jgi:hypothetical protein